MPAYYNEIDPFAVAWLRELIARKLIAPGVVDDRSIEAVTAKDLEGFTQCHFFAGIGVWSYSLRLAGWPDDRPVWTASCPCPPFSSAGKQKPCPRCGGSNPVPHVGRTGYFVCCLCDHAWLADGRHLYPELWRLIDQCRPESVFGEQVASRDGRTWLALVRASLEIVGYAVGCADTSAAIVGAPHIRQRLYFVADAGRHGVEQHARIVSGDEGEYEVGAAFSHHPPVPGRAASSVAEPEGERCSPRRLGESFSLRPERSERSTEQPDGCGSSGVVVDADGGGSCEGRFAGETVGHRCAAGAAGCAGELVNTTGSGRTRRDGANVEEQGPGARCATRELGDATGRDERRQWKSEAIDRQEGALGGSGPRGGFWDDAEYIPCTDGKARPVEPGTFPLAHGAPARVGRLRGYGNAINAEQAAAFIEAFLDVRGG